MLVKLGASIISALKSAFVIVALFLALVIFVKWAQANPDDLSALGNKIGTVAVNLINWTLDTINGAVD